MWRGTSPSGSAPGIHYIFLGWLQKLLTHRITTANSLSLSYKGDAVTSFYPLCRTPRGLCVSILPLGPLSAILRPKSNQVESHNSQSLPWLRLVTSVSRLTETMTQLRQALLVVLCRSWCWFSAPPRLSDFQDKLLLPVIFSVPKTTVSDLLQASKIFRLAKQPTNFSPGNVFVSISAGLTEVWILTTLATPLAITSLMKLYFVAICFVFAL